jgi:hypothetical protein
VPPGDTKRCVRNITFKDVHAEYPIKMIYIKTGHSSNSSSSYSAIIENIVYENISASFSLLAPIYIGPQQQKEPDGTGDGFFKVPTEPRVTIRNITFSNVNISNNIMSAGLLRCNASNPCTSVNFNNVQVTNMIPPTHPLYHSTTSFSLFNQSNWLWHHKLELLEPPSPTSSFVCDAPDLMYGNVDQVSYPDPSICVLPEADI